jgi:hypothetical protein
MKDNRILRFNENSELNISDVSDSDLRFKSEDDKQLIYDSISNKDICMWYDEEIRDWLLDILNRSPGSLPF